MLSSWQRPPKLKPRVTKYRSWKGKEIPFDCKRPEADIKFTYKKYL